MILNICSRNGHKGNLLIFLLCYKLWSKAWFKAEWHFKKELLISSKVCKHIPVIPAFCRQSRGLGALGQSGQHSKTLVSKKTKRIKNDPVLKLFSCVYVCVHGVWV